MRLYVKSAFLFVLAAAAAQDIAGFADFTLTLDVGGIDDDEEVIDGDDLQLVILATIDAGLLDVLEVFKVGVAVVMDGVDEVQCTGGFGRAVGAGAS